MAASFQLYVARCFAVCCAPGYSLFFVSAPNGWNAGENSPHIERFRMQASNHMEYISEKLRELF